MKNFLKNTKGAVTVFVTLLLIPAMLVSGTAVDLARIHTARSIVQDANQLAANSVLTQYNALLYDLYGLFGVAENDPIFAELLEKYIRVSIFGEERQDRSVGTLQVFYGSDVSLEGVDFAADKNLRNEDVLRRQIEEYMKFRAPVIIVKEFLELTGLASFKEDAAVIEDKLDIEAAIFMIYEKYKELYNAIIAADKCNQVNGGIANVTVGIVSSSLENIRNEFVQLEACYRAWERARTQSAKDDYAAKFTAILDNIRIRTVGGRIGSNWSGGRWTVRASSPVLGLNATIENAKENGDRHKPLFDRVVEISLELDKMKDDLSEKIDKLEERLNSGGCNPELRRALTERTGSPAKSIIERYRDILEWSDLEGMGVVYKDSGYEYIDVTLKNMLEGVIYRNRQNSSDPSLSRTQLAGGSNLTLSDTILAAESIVAVLAGYTRDNFAYLMPPFAKYADQSERHKAFFEELTQLMNQPDISPIKLFDGQDEAGGGDSEKKQRNMINELLEMVRTAYSGLASDPLGAKYIDIGTVLKSDDVDLEDFSSLVSEAKNNNVVDVIMNPTGSVARAGDHLLLLTYCTSLFSNYTTARPESNGKTRDDLSGFEFPKSMTGVPMSPEVNYFFQSEWEYLYNGSTDAKENLSAVSRLIFLIRIICNYIAVFTVPSVSNVINSIRATFSWSPVLAVLLGELARAAFVAAESAVDVANLRQGYKIPFVKRSSQWKCSPSGLKQALADVGSDFISSAGGASNGANSNREDSGLSYSNYLMFFFIAKALFSTDAAGELAQRTGNLIEWNVVNYQNSINSDEEKMTEALASSGRFKLEDMKTDFSLTTTVDMRMLFLSMIFSQNFSDSRGIGMQTTMPVSVTDYRGY